MNQILITLFISCILHKSYGEFYDDPLVKLFEDAVNKNITSEKCMEDINIFLERLNETRNKDSWALKMLAASAKVPETILAYDYGDLGHFTECIEIESQKDKILGKYCLGSLFLNNNDTREAAKEKILIWSHWAFCIPSNCTNEDFKQLMYNFHFLDINITEDDITCQTYEDAHPKFSEDAVIGFVVFGILLLILMLSTCFDIVYSYRNKCDNGHPILIAFSVYTNGKKLFSLPRRSSNLSCLDGLKVFNLLGVIFQHFLVFFLAPTYIIKKDVIQFERSFLREIFRSAPTLGVDSFFMYGGLLVSYLYFKKEKLQNITVGSILKHYLHRWIRLTPAFAGVVLFTVTLLKYMGSGPTWPYQVKDYLVLNCQENWWIALLFIQNEAITENECLLPSWYLDVDMQIYLFSPLIFFVLKKYFKIGVVLISSACVASLSLAVMGGTTNITYYHTETRMTPWLIGTLLGYALTKKRLTDIRFSKKISLLLWILSFFLISICTIGEYKPFFSTEYFEILKAFIDPLRKPLFVLALGWIVWACSTNQGGIVNDFLSLPGFQYINKLSYSMYMVHLPIELCSLGAVTTLYEANFLYFVTWISWIYLFTILLSIVWVLTFEMPIVNLENYFFYRQIKSTHI